MKPNYISRLVVIIIGITMLITGSVCLLWEWMPISSRSIILTG